MREAHSLHIPVMGLGFAIDTPAKVAHLGIDSVLAIGDHMLIERMRKLYCDKMGLPYVEINEKFDDFRARRITEYLNLLNELAEQKLEALRSSISDKGEMLREYFDLLPDNARIKEEFTKRFKKWSDSVQIKQWLKENLRLGSIDVNIMTKVDMDKYEKGKKLPVENNDAHVSLRGFALSKLSSSLILSAGMNPRLFGYMEQFDDFYPDENGQIKKKIVLKVSDYRSAIIQGKFLAKKGLWVSEYRVESGLNCGGHAFATTGYLMGPILEEFKKNREALAETVFTLYREALKEKGKFIPEKTPEIKISAQGGVGTAAEHEFLLDFYQLDSVGWGTPFLLVPEVTNVDEETLDQLIKAREKDLYLSNISPLGEPFNNLRGNSKDREKEERIARGKPGSPCVKKYLKFNNELTERPICTASRQYQSLKIKELMTRDLTPELFSREYRKVVEKTCLCVGLSTSALKVNALNRKSDGDGVAICPGPNLAYFSRKLSLHDMVDHIYGRKNVIERNDRPHMFVKELRLYLKYFMDKLEDTGEMPGRKKEKYLNTFLYNLEEGIAYYRQLFSEHGKIFNDQLRTISNDLNAANKQVNVLKNKMLSVLTKEEV